MALLALGGSDRLPGVLTISASIALAFAVQTARPVPLDSITLDHASRLVGRRVVVTFIAATPAYTWCGQTIIGTHEQPDGTERTAHFAGKRYDVDAGQRLTLVGTLRMIRHALLFVDGKPLPGWVEVRIVESVR